MKKNNLLQVLLFMMLFFSDWGYAILNGNFESAGTSNGSVVPPANWTFENNAGLYSSLVPDSPNTDWSISSPYEEEYFLVLSTGGMDDIPDQSITKSSVSQEWTFHTGDVLSFAWIFGTTDYLPYTDVASVTLSPINPNDNLPEISLVEIDVSDIGSFGSSGMWQVFDFTFDSSNEGTYDLIFQVTDDADYLYASYFAIDAVQVVPEPATLSLLALGGLTLLRKRK